MGCHLNPRLRLPDLTGLDAAVDLTEVPFHPQEAHHCGPASLLTVLEASGVEVAYEEVVERVYVPGLEGSLQAEMSATSRRFGRLAYKLPPTPEAVLAEVEAGRPVLVLLNLGLPSRPFWHYAVVVGFEPAANRILMRSGTRRRLEKRAPSWLRSWDWAGRWALVLLRPDEWPEGPERARLLQALADFEDTADPRDARTAWSNAVVHWPEEPMAWLGLGNSASALEDPEGAVTAYRRALELDPGLLPVRLNLASSLLAAGRPCVGLAEIGPEPALDHALRPTFDELSKALRESCASFDPSR